MLCSKRRSLSRDGFRSKFQCLKRCLILYSLIEWECFTRVIKHKHSLFSSVWKLWWNLKHSGFWSGPFKLTVISCSPHTSTEICLKHLELLLLKVMNCPMIGLAWSFFRFALYCVAVNELFFVSCRKDCHGQHGKGSPRQRKWRKGNL